MEQNNIQLVTDSIAALETGGAAKDKDVRKLIDQLLKSSSSPDHQLVAKIIERICENDDAKTAKTVLSLGLWLARSMTDKERLLFDEHLFRKLFAWCSDKLDPANLDLLLLARILGDKADDNFEWNRSQFWFEAMINDVSNYKIGANEAALKTLESYAFRQLAALAIRKKEYGRAWDYSMSDFNLFKDSGDWEGKEIISSLDNLAYIAEQAGWQQKAAEINQMRLKFK